MDVGCIGLEMPGTKSILRPGYTVRLGRFSDTNWIVAYGWYTWGGNRPVCGWYLISADPRKEVKPLQLPDLDDIYVIKM